MKGSVYRDPARLIVLFCQYGDILLPTVVIFYLPSTSLKEKLYVIVDCADLEKSVLANCKDNAIVNVKKNNFNVDVTIGNKI